MNDTLPGLLKASSNKVAREIRAHLRALGPKDTAARKLLQKRLAVLAKPAPLDMLAWAKEAAAACSQHRADRFTRRDLARHERRRHRIRLRLPRFFEGAVVDTKAAGEKLYFELASGQIVEATRINGIRLTSGSVRNNAKRRRLLAPLGNPALRRVVREAVSANANRSAQ